MYVHIGGNCSISDKIICGIYDFDQMTQDKIGDINRQFLRKQHEQFHVMTISEDLPKSFVVTLEGIYLSPIASHILLQRLQSAVTTSFLCVDSEGNSNAIR